MSKRKDDLKSLFAPTTAAEIVDDYESIQAPRAAGPVRSMADSFTQLARAADHSRELSEKFSMGETIIELDTTLIDPSFVQDRIDPITPQSVAQLVDLIRESGQQSPILVRPHPNKTERYQIAYGRRRLVALSVLERPIKSLVRQMSDEELVRAQANENLGRNDLSFIEMGLFAQRLEDQGISRPTIRSALGHGDSLISMLINLTRSIPEDLITTIGSAPKIGRPNWAKLAKLISETEVDWKAITSDPYFLRLGTNERFNHVIAAVNPVIPSVRKNAVKDERGKAFAILDRKNQDVKLTINDKKTGGFGAYLAEKLPEFYAAFRKSKIES